MKIAGWSVLFRVVFGAGLGLSVAAQDVDFCADGERTDLCPEQPVDIVEFDASFIYRFIATDAQEPFDRFSWQAFIAVNWPLDEAGRPLPLGYTTPDAGTLRWETYATQPDVVEPARRPSACPIDSSQLTLSQFRQASDDVLVDTAGNFVLYETRLNPVSREYIDAQGLSTKENRARRSEPIDFPRQSDQGPGAQLLKFAWKILTDSDNAADYLVRSARIDIAAEDAWDNQPHCLTVRVALVGLHLVQRVSSGHGDRWIWSTFEHEANAPLAGNARGPNSIMASRLFPQGCLAPDTVDRDYSFYSPSSDQPTNTQAAVNAVWHDQPPYALNGATGSPLPSANLVRCWRVFEGTEALNDTWRKALAGTVWEHYFLVGTQWIGNGGGEPFGTGEVPRFLTNATLESFIQHQPSGSCLSCHDGARTDANQPSNLTFVLNPGP